MGGSTPYSGAAASPNNVLQLDLATGGGGLSGSIAQTQIRDIDSRRTLIENDYIAQNRRNTPFFYVPETEAAGAGTLSIGNNDRDVIGVGTAFLTSVKRGDYIIVNTAANDIFSFIVTHVYSDTRMTVFPNASVAIAAGTPYRIRKLAQQDAPIIYHPSYYFNNVTVDTDPEYDPIGVMYGALIGNSADLFETSSNLAAVSIDATTNALLASIDASLSSFGTIDVTLRDRLVEIADRVVGVSVDANIALYVDPVIAKINVERDAAITEMSKAYTIANGFFNTNVLDRIAEITAKYATQTAATRAEMTQKIMDMIYAQAIDALQVINTLSIPGVAQKLGLAQLRLSTAQAGAGLMQSALQVMLNQLVAGVQYGMEQAKRDYANDLAMWSGPLESAKDQANLLAAYNGIVNANLSKAAGANQATGNVLTSTLGGAQMGAGLGAPGGPIGVAIGAGAGAILGMHQGFYNQAVGG